MNYTYTLKGISNLLLLLRGISFYLLIRLESLILLITPITLLFLFPTLPFYLISSLTLPIYSSSLFNYVYISFSLSTPAPALLTPSRLSRYLTSTSLLKFLFTNFTTISISLLSLLIYYINLLIYLSANLPTIPFTSLFNIR